MPEQFDINQFAKNLPPGSKVGDIAAAAASGAAIGSVIPGIGTTIGAGAATLAAVFGVNIKGKTVTFDRDAAVAYSSPIADKIADGLREKLTPLQYDQLARELPEVIARVIETSGAWSEDKRRYFAEQIRIVTVPSRRGNPRNLIAESIWQMLVWIVSQSPNDRADWVQDYTHFYLEKTLGELLRSYGVAPTTSDLGGNGSGAPPNDGSSTQPPGPNLAGFTFDSKTIMIAAAVVIALLVIKGLK